MEISNDIIDFINHGDKQFIPHLSIDSVIFGYHESQLKVLLLCWDDVDAWCLPGGHVGRVESIDDAANRILMERTGLTNVFLQQYYTFGDTSRSQPLKDEDPLKASWIYEIARNSWLADRKVSIGYYALVEYSKVVPKADKFSRECSWWDIHSLPVLLFDHARMIELALQTIRSQLNSHPIGLNLLPDQFTLPELQKLYETILDKQLDRRNFQKKILSMDILEKLFLQRQIGPHRSPNLYSFDKVKYNQALAQGKGLVYY